MASRRMFSKDVVCSDRFLDMPASAQALYFQYGLEADDDGFVSAPKKILRLTNASDDDLKILVAKGFLIPFDSGVVVIRDWKINNYLRRDRYTPTRFKKEFKQLDTIDDRYQLHVLTVGIPDDNHVVDMRDAVYGGKLCEYVLFFPIRKEYIHKGDSGTKELRCKSRRYGIGSERRS